MPGQFLEAPTYQMTVSDFNDGSYFIRELRRRGVFKCGIVKLQLPEEVTGQLESQFTDLGDVQSDQSFYKTFSKVPLHSYVEQNVSIVDRDEGVFEILHVPVATSSSSDHATVGDFYEFAKRERAFGTYKGIVQPKNGEFDDVHAKKVSRAFWKACGEGVTKEKPFLYGADIGVAPSTRLGAYADLDLVTVSCILECC